MTELVSLAILVPLAAALLVGALPRSEPGLARALGLIGALVELGVIAALILGFDPSGPAVQQVQVFGWMPAYGIAISLGVDGQALAWLAVVGLVFPLALMIGKGPRPGEPPLIVGMLGLQAAWVAVLLARDVVTLAAAWEIAAFTLVILVGERGDGLLGVPGRTQAARRLALRWIPGAAALIGAVVLLGVAHAHATGGVWRWDLDALATISLAPASQQLGFALVMVAVASSLPLIPLHGGLVAACVSGPTPVVAVLLGAGMPMAVFVLVRVGLPLFPLAAGEWADPIAALAVVGGVYAALVCWAEREPGRLLAHVALVHLALAIVAAVSGSASAGLGLGPYLLAHGLGLVTLTCCAHALRRDGVDNLGELAGWAAVAPRKLALAMLASLVLAGVPGTVGFLGELGIVAGVIREGDVELVRPSAWGLLATAAVGLGALGLLRTLWHAGRGSPRLGLGERLSELDLRETSVGVVALGLALVLGLAPHPLLTRTEPAARAAVEQLHRGRCLAIHARGSSRPRTHTELIDARGAVCLDPVAEIRLLYFPDRATTSPGVGVGEAGSAGEGQP
jgi:NADH-quinone oxidoreductase subunit M